MSMTVEFPEKSIMKIEVIGFQTLVIKFFLSEKEIQWFLFFFCSPILLLEFLILGCAPRTLGCGSKMIVKYLALPRDGFGSRDLATWVCVYLLPH